jgi:hypothetical protein
MIVTDCIGRSTERTNGVPFKLLIGNLIFKFVLSVSGVCSCLQQHYEISGYHFQLGYSHCLLQTLQFITLIRTF